jgi:tripartite-type tricarboxylate transporter receptor subunit TctC
MMPCVQIACRSVTAHCVITVRPFALTLAMTATTSGRDALSALREVPTMAEPVISRLRTELVRKLKSPDICDRLISEGAGVETSTPEEFAGIIRAEIPQWSQAVKDSGSKLD